MPDANSSELPTSVAEPVHRVGAAERRQGRRTAAGAEGVVEQQHDRQQRQARRERSADEHDRRPGALDGGPYHRPVIMPSRRAGRALAAGLLGLLAAAGCGDELRRRGHRRRARPRRVGAPRRGARGRADPAGEGRAREAAALHDARGRILGDVVKRFSADTGIAVTLYRAKSEELLERVARESRADVDGADVVEANGAGLRDLSTGTARSRRRPASSPAAGRRRRRERLDRLAAQWFVVSRNTEAVPRADERPRSVADLADPRWRGRIADRGRRLGLVRDTLREHWIGDGGTQRGRRPTGASRRSRATRGSSTATASRASCSARASSTSPPPTTPTSSRPSSGGCAGRLEPAGRPDRLP